MRREGSATHFVFEVHVGAGVKQNFNNAPMPFKACQSDDGPAVLYGDWAVWGQDTDGERTRMIS